MKNIKFTHNGKNYSMNAPGLNWMVINGYVTEEKPYTQVAEFVYLNSKTGENEWRKIGVVENESSYLAGLDLNDGDAFKKFLKSRVVGGSKKIFLSKA